MAQVEEAKGTCEEDVHAFHEARGERVLASHGDGDGVAVAPRFHGEHVVFAVGLDGGGKTGGHQGEEVGAHQVVSAGQTEGGYAKADMLHRAGTQLR